jgi:hypothetical protein
MSLTRVPRRMLDVDIADQQYVLDQIAALTTDSISEGTLHRYYTNDRARNAINVSGGLLSYNVTTGIIDLLESDITEVARLALTVTGDLEYNPTTGVLNYVGQHITNEQIQDVIAPLFTGGTHQYIDVVYDDASNHINLAVNIPSTDVIPEGATNKYFHISAARAAISAGAGAYYDELNGVISVNPFFAGIAVPGRTTVVADVTGDTLTIAPVANSGLVINTIPQTNTVTLGVNPFFSTVDVTGQSPITADVVSDTFTITKAVNSGLNLTTSGNTLTIGVLPFFDKVAVTGRTSVTADATSDTLTIEPATDSGMVIDTVPASNKITFKVNPYFATIEVPGKTSVTADVTSDTFKLVAGANITLNTIPAQNAITISATGGGGGGSADPLEMLSTAMIYG